MLIQTTYSIRDHVLYKGEIPATIWAIKVNAYALHPEGQLLTTWYEILFDEPQTCQTNDGYTFNVYSCNAEDGELIPFDDREIHDILMQFAEAYKNEGPGPERRIRIRWHWDFQWHWLDGYVVYENDSFYLTRRAGERAWTSLPELDEIVSINYSNPKLRGTCPIWERKPK